LSGTDVADRAFARRNHGGAIVKKPAFAFFDSLASRFVRTMGVVNLFADMTYEGVDRVRVEGDHAARI
jgi:hypothetical protein